MKRDFPSNERPPAFAVYNCIAKGLYEAYYFIDEAGREAGYAVVTAPKEYSCALLNFFAVMPEMRGGGVGTTALAVLGAQYPDRVMLLEAEDPAHTQNDDKASTARRRLAFYNRAGYQTQPTRRAVIFGVPMVIMASGNLPRDEGVRQVMHALYKPTLGRAWLRHIDVW